MIEKTIKSYQNDLECTSPPCDKLFINGRPLVWRHRDQKVAVHEKELQEQVDIYFGKPMKNLDATSASFQVCLASVGINANTSAVRWDLNDAGLHGRIRRKKPLLTKKHKQAQLKYTKAHINKLEMLWQNVLWSDETKLDHLGRNDRLYVWRTLQCQQLNMAEEALWFGGALPQLEHAK